MSNRGLIVTVVGWAATTPKEIVGRVPFTSFRLATTPRYYDSSKGAWTDGHTEWLTVKVFRDVALNVAKSVDKGDPVIVHGKLRTEEWQGENGPRTGLVLEAHALGHDLTRGRSEFVRTVYVAPAAEAEQPGGAPAADPWAVGGSAASTATDGVGGVPDDGVAADDVLEDGAGVDDVLEDGAGTDDVLDEYDTAADEVFDEDDADDLADEELIDDAPAAEEAMALTP